MGPIMREWIDTHLHLLYVESLHYDWTRSYDALKGRVALEDYMPLAQTNGITRALHMEADVRESESALETRLISQLMDIPGSPVVGAIAACRPESEQFPSFLESQQANPRVHGLRRVLHTMPDDVSLSEVFRRNLRLLPTVGYTFDLCVLARQLPLAIELARACPDVTMVLDHCGVPNVMARELSPWREHIQALAALPNVFCKISGLIAYGDAARWPIGDVESVAADLRPFVEHAIECFGWERVVWGSDFPVCNLTRGLPVWRAVTDCLLQGCSDVELDALAHGNAIRLYRLQPAMSTDTMRQR
jgi:predicted TIM-barrel fold metal-dependent hydrolase